MSTTFTLPVFICAWSWNLDRETGQLSDPTDVIVYQRKPEPQEHIICIGVGEVAWQYYEKIDVVKQQVDGVERQIKETHAEYQSKLNELQERKANLLALPAPEKT